MMMTGLGKHRTVIISIFDYPRLQKMLEQSSNASSKSDYLRDLKRELQRASVVAPEQIPPYVVTMNTQFSLSDSSTGKKAVYTLVFPDEADFGDGKLSILSHLGVAVFGCCVGDTVEYEAPEGHKRIRIDMICFQPEATKQFEM